MTKPSTPGEAGALSLQVGGNHYKDLPLQPIEHATRQEMDPCTYSMFKYLVRWRSKDGKKDLGKAEHFLALREEFRTKEDTIPPRDYEIPHFLQKNQGHIAPDTAYALICFDWYTQSPTEYTLAMLRHALDLLNQAADAEARVRLPAATP